MTRRPLTCRQVLLTVLASASVAPVAASEFRTRNFVVSARRSEVARQVAEYAEQFRRTKALDWLGRELPPWNDPCEVEVKITFGGAGGATSFTFGEGQVLGQQMSVEGTLERILHSVLPHEITHTIFAARFGRPLPRWADEGGAVLSEDFQELSRHDLLVRELINSDRMMPLSRLFVLTEYPRDVMVLYAQGFSVANFLVSLKGRLTYLDFVSDGQQTGWREAAYRYFGFRSVEELESYWIDWLIAGKGTGADGPLIVAGEAPRRDAGFGSAAQVAPSARTPSLLVRGQIPDESEAPARTTMSLGPDRSAASGGRTALRENVVAAPERLPRSWLGAIRRGERPGRGKGPRREEADDRPVSSYESIPVARSKRGSTASRSSGPGRDANRLRREPANGRIARVEPHWARPGIEPQNAQADSESPGTLDSNTGVAPLVRNPRRLIPIAVGRTRLRTATDR